MTDRAPRTPIPASPAAPQPAHLHSRIPNTADPSSGQQSAPADSIAPYPIVDNALHGPSSTANHLFAQPYAPGAPYVPAPILQEHREIQEESSSASIIESIAFSRNDTIEHDQSSRQPRNVSCSRVHSAGSSPSGISSSSSRAPSSSAYAAALRDMSRRSAGRSASIIGGAGGVVGEPMGVPGMGPTSGLSSVQRGDVSLGGSGAGTSRSSRSSRKSSCSLRVSAGDTRGPTEKRY